MPTWLRNLYISLGVIKPQPPLWRPIYENLQRYVYSPTQSGSVAVAVNRQYLLTKQSAVELGVLLNGLAVEEDFLTSGGAVTANFKIWYLHFVDSFTNVKFKIIAGSLAFYFCPAEEFNSDGIITEGKPSQAVLDNTELPLNQCRQRIQAAKLDELRQIR